MNITSNIKEVLKEWVISYLKNKDIVQKKIESVSEHPDGFDASIKYKDKELFIVVQPFLQDFEHILQKITKDTHLVVVVLNVEENLKHVLDKWKRLIEFPKLSVYFVNPDSPTEKKWIINPYIHNMWADQENLKQGIRSMYETVAPYGGS